MAIETQPAIKKQAERRTRPAAQRQPAFQLYLPISILVLLASVALAYGLRIYHLGVQSLWYDEGFSVYLSAQPLSVITERTANDIQPPLYYYMLHFWMLAAGKSEFAVRFLSLIFGVLCVPLLAKLALQLFRSPVAAGCAALLGAALPVLVYYGQETRMYTVLVALCAVAAWCQLKLIAHYTTAGLSQSRTWLLWAGYVLACIAAIYTHYYAFFFIAAGGIAWLGWLVARRPGWGVFARCVLAAWAIGAAYLPWGQFALTRYTTDTSYWEGTLDLGTILRQTVIMFSGTGVIEVADDRALALAPVWGIFLLLGIVALIWRGAHEKDRRSWGTLLYLLLWLVVPVLLLWAISYARPKFHPRYLLLIAPVYVLLLARGMTALDELGKAIIARPRLARQTGAALLGVGLLVIGMLTWDGLANNYFNPAFARDDWRSVAKYIEANSAPNDEIVLMAGHTFPVLTYYYDRDNWHKVPPEDFTLSTHSIVGFNIANQLNQIAQGKQGNWQLWVVLWQDQVVDPNGVLVRQLNEHAQRLSVGQSFQGLHLLRYELKPGVTFNAQPDIQHPVQVNFGDKLHFAGYDAGASVASGSSLPMTFYWNAAQQLSDDYSFTLRLVDENHHEWGRIDRRPANNPTQRWHSGELVPGATELQIAPGTPPGTYTMELGVYSQINGKPGPSLDVLENGIATGQEKQIGTLTVLPATNPPAESSLTMGQKLDQPVGNGKLQLLGATINTPQVNAGESLGFSLFWRSPTQPDGDYRIKLTLGNASLLTYPAGAEYPTNRWSAGEILHGQYDLPVPANIEPGEYPLEVTLTDAGGTPIGNPVQVTKVKVAGREHKLNPPANIQIQAGARLSTTIELLGYDIESRTLQPGQDLRLTLHWHALAPVSTSYKVFTQLIAPGRANPVIAQSDKIPGDYKLPTTSWITGEYIDDQYIIHIKDDTPPGKYLLITGMYPDPNGPRLPVFDAQGTPAGDTIQLGEIEVRAK